MPKLLHIFPSTEKGGAESYSLKVTSRAAHQGWNVHVAFPQAESTELLKQQFEENDIHYHPLEITEEKPGKVRIGQIFLPRFLRTLFLILKIKPDVIAINVTFPPFCFPSIMACAFFAIPTCVVFHLIPEKFNLSSRQLKSYSWARQRNQNWVAVSQQNRQLIAATFHCSLDDIQCIYTGANIPTISVADKDIKIARESLRQNLNLPPDSCILLSVGRLDSQKGYLDLIPTIPHLLKDFPNIYFLWAGDGEQKPKLINKLKEYGIQERVHFLGFRSDIPDLLMAADLFVFPSHYEGLPFAVLEAMAYKLPVVSSDASGIPEVIKDSIHGVLFKSKDSCDLLEKIRWALRNLNTMQEMAQEAQARVGDFSEHKMVEQTLKMYIDIYAKHNRPKIEELVSN